MKKILVFGMTENPGGVESVIMNYYRHINKNEFSFDFLCNTEKVAYEEEIKKLKGNIYKIPARSKNIIKYKICINNFFKENANRYDIIWVNLCSLANIDYLKLAKKYGIRKRIIHCHNSQNMDSKFRKVIHLINKRKLYKFATDYWTCAKDAENWFFEKNIKSHKEVLLVKNAIDVNKFKFNALTRTEMRKKLKINANEIVFGNIGRLHFQKNQAKLINIFYEIHKKTPNVKLFLVGDGDDKEKIILQINSLHLNDSVILLGVRTDIEKVMQAFDALIFPSLFEGMPLVLIESQANGMPIFASSTITNDVKFSSNMYFVDINLSDKEWANYILNHDIIRMDNTENIIKNGYDIASEVKKIEKQFNS